MPTETCAYRYHDISCGHRVVGQGGKCEMLHGHNYRFWLHCKAVGDLDDVGRVIDFGVIKSTLCQWLEDNWDHRMLIWEQDPLLRTAFAGRGDLGVVAVPFNPTAENMAAHLLNVVGPAVLPSDVYLAGVRVEETRKCGATVTLA